MPLLMMPAGWAVLASYALSAESGTYTITGTAATLTYGSGVSPSPDVRVLVPADVTIRPGDLVVKDPADISVYLFDWDEHLAAGVTIESSSWTITALRPSTDTALTKDEETLPTSRTAQVQLSAGTLGALYQVANTIVTSETPAQTKERSFRLLIQHL